MFDTECLPEDTFIVVYKIEGEDLKEKKYIAKKYIHEKLKPEYIVTKSFKVVPLTHE